MIEALTPKFSKKIVKVIGCGFAGAELAFILANNGFIVHIFDGGNNKQKNAFEYDGKRRELSCKRERDKALLCKSEGENQLTKFTFEYYSKYQKFLTENMEFELDCMNSPILSIAKRMEFADFGIRYDEDFMFAVRKELEKNPNIQLFEGNIAEINPNEITVIATGHNTDKNLLKEVEKIVGPMRICHFQPQNLIVDANSVDLGKLNFANKYECYANLSEEEYFAFNEKAKAFDEKYEKNEKEENQITIEAIARRGHQALRNSIFRPHFDEKTKCYASLKMTYNPYYQILTLEDFCSALDEEEQVELIHSIPALSECKILECGKVLRRKSLLSPACLDQHLRISENCYVCGGFAGTTGVLEGMLLANYCAYRLICDFACKCGAEVLLENTCIGKIVENLLKKSVIKFRLFSLKYDIIELDGLKNFERELQLQKFLSKSQIEKFKEKFYGKYF